MRRIAIRIATTVLCLCLAAPALAAPGRKAAEKRPEKAAEAAPAKAEGFDAEAFRRHFIAGLVGRPNAPKLSVADVRVLSADKAASFAGTEIYAVRGELGPGGDQPQPFTMFVSADGRFYVSDLVDLEAGRSLFKAAREKMLAEDLKDLGHVVLKGQGRHNVVYVSDPFCPYCRQAFAYLMEKKAQMAEFRLAHFPLSSHPGADIACALMAWAVDKAPDKALEFARFAYTELPAPKPADRSEQSLKKAWTEVAQAFLKRFPELSALGKDGEAIVAALTGSPWDEAVRRDMAQAAGMDVTGTPVVFVGGARVEGFDQQRLGSLLK